MPIKVLIASPLRSYTGADEVDAAGGTLGALLADLDTRYPGIRFRMIDEQDAVRRHIRFFINGEPVKALDHPLRETDEVCIVQALSGGQGNT
ncbi:MAG TPA: MoaD/ThiS family protein [Rhizomicrobium sp.]|jgi:molybdopterin converting factor small subunit|nr:MoaD/ThiS family protein [Rhizomicrobium sp.]